MKRSILWALCLSVVSAFAGSYDISEFEAKESGSPDEYITAEFGGELKVAPADEVESLQNGRLVVRQKFEDPFDADATTYQLYQGGAGDLSSMTAMTAEGVDYSKLVTAKVYARRGMDSNKDVEKVYFDGKSVFAPGLSSAVVFIDGEPVTLKGDAAEEPVAAATASSSNDDEYCDDDDEDCEDEDLSKYKTSAPVANSDADDRDYAASEAADVGDRFGIADEVRFWSAVGLSALAAASIVLGITQHKKSNEAKDAYDTMDELYSGIMDMCGNDKGCQQAVLEKGVSGVWTVQNLKNRMDTNKKTQDSYATARNIWFGIAGASIAGAVVLFVW
ncbi:hypothetical protein [Fibrobacter sp. UWEL]|uniref:hypothetical protein n=1 Tax=Fibrobacter sp. UWEL TaxID=1896209 RepID=UPI00091EB5AC|nr:hypothetical protein [Fibrobacter sp. UWEL]SHL09220.1 hypothetical protein SAMN05720468_11351 [Fibrobacter sp. UWEL]